MAQSTKTLKSMMVFAVMLLILAAPNTTLADEHGVFISDEVGGSSENAAELVDQLDEEWRSALIAEGTAGDDFEKVTVSPEQDEIIEVETDQDTKINVSVQNITDPTNSSDQGTPHTKQGFSGSTEDATLEKSAPKPASLAEESYYAHTGGGTTSPNGVLVNFEEPVAAFGAWFGDLETSTKGDGAAALLRVYDTSNNLIGGDIEIAPTASDDANRTANEGYGENSTRWIGFIAPEDQPASSFVTVVGASDADDNVNRNTFSLTGLTIVPGLSSEAASEIGEDESEQNTTVEFDESDQVVYDTTSSDTVEDEAVESVADESESNDEESAEAETDHSEANSSEVQNTTTVDVESNEVATPEATDEMTEEGHAASVVHNHEADKRHHGREHHHDVNHDYQASHHLAATGFSAVWSIVAGTLTLAIVGGLQKIGRLSEYRR